MNLYDIIIIINCNFITSFNLSKYIIKCGDAEFE